MIPSCNIRFAKVNSYSKRLNWKQFSIVVQKGDYSGANFMVSNCPEVVVQGGIIQGQLSGGKNLAGNCPGMNFMGVSCPGGSCPGGNYLMVIVG